MSEEGELVTLITLSILDEIPNLFHSIVEYMSDNMYAYVYLCYNKVSCCYST